MPNPLKQFINRRLKENVPLSNIKKDLQEKGYSIETINKTVREVISDVGSKLPSASAIQIGILVVGVVIAIGTAVYFTGVSREQSSSNVFCDAFKKTNYQISCNNAVTIALASVQGTVQNVEIGSVQMFDTSEPPRKIATEMWLVDVRVNNPSFNAEFQKTVQVLRIGVGLNGNAGIYKEVVS